MSSTCSRVNALFASFFDLIPNSLKIPLAVALRAKTTGFSAIARPYSGGTRTSAARSGIENEMFLGIISPTKTWRNETINKATPNETAVSADSGKPRACNGSLSSSWMLGSATRRISSPEIVTPSWQVAKIRLTSSMALMVSFAGVEPAFALGSI